MRGTVERLYLTHGSSANAFSAAYDPDLHRHVSPCGSGFVAYARCLGTTIAFFDPVCDEHDLPVVLDNFLSAMRPHGRVGFWKVSEATAHHLSHRGYALAPYGLENDFAMGAGAEEDLLRGSQLRGLRREVRAARAAGVRVEPIHASDDSLWGSLASVNRAWLATRARRVEIKRATRRCPLLHEEHCTKLVARDSDGIVGWAALDHVYAGGALIGGGLSTVRWRPDAPTGVAALLALDGASHLMREHHSQSVMHSDGASSSFVLALGESPLAPLPPALAAPLASPSLTPARTSRSLSALFRVAYNLGNTVYNAEGLTRWKRKWRCEQRPLFCAVENEPPLREILAGAALIL